MSPCHFLPSGPTGLDKVERTTYTFLEPIGGSPRPSSVHGKSARQRLPRRIAHHECHMCLVRYLCHLSPHPPKAPTAILSRHSSNTCGKLRHARVPAPAVPRRCRTGNSGRHGSAYRSLACGDYPRKFNCADRPPSPRAPAPPTSPILRHFAACLADSFFSPCPPCPPCSIPISPSSRSCGMLRHAWQIAFLSPRERSRG
jgi:hypothetical protein